MKQEFSSAELFRATTRQRHAIQMQEFSADESRDARHSYEAGLVQWTIECQRASACFSKIARNYLGIE